MRFLHLADVHLDTGFESRSERIRRALRDASRRALEGAVTLAIEGGVDAVLIAGDLFDGDRLSFETERFLLAELERLGEAGIPVVYATGNHDPGRGELRAHALEWPENVFLLRESEPVRVPVEGAGGSPVGFVTGAGHETSHETRDLAGAFPDPGGELPEVALLHTQVVGARTSDRHDPYAPAELDTLRRSGFDYWALGHVHVRQALSDDPPIHYPGNLQGRNPRETGPKGGLLVTLGEGAGPEVTFHPLGPIRWETVRVDGIGEARSLKELEGAMARRWEEARTEDPGAPGTEWILRVELSGPSPLHRELSRDDDVATLEEELGPRLGALDVDVRATGVHAPISVDEHRERQDVLGEALALAGTARDEPETLASLRPEVLAGVAEGDVDDARAYLRELAEGLERDIVARLRREDGNA